MSSAYRKLAVIASIVGGLALATASSAKAAFVTTNEAGMDVIFGVAGLSIDIRFNPMQTLNNPSLLNITTDAQLDELLGFGGPTPPVFLYFVDTVDACGGFNTAIVGCANSPGNAIVVESEFAATGFGAELNAHELGHSLGLGHPADMTNLMWGEINNDISLNPDQIDAILASPLVQTGAGGQRFVSITPVLVTPLPPAGILFISGLMGLYWMKRRKTAANDVAV